jgi:hypothetical protein
MNQKGISLERDLGLERVVAIDFADGPDSSYCVMRKVLLEAMERLVPVGGHVTINGAPEGEDTFCFSVRPPSLATKDTQAFKRVSGNVWERTR